MAIAMATGTATAMATATATATTTAMATTTATATATATEMVGDGMLTAMMAMARYGDAVAKTRTYLHRQLEFFLSDTSCWIKKKYKNLKNIHT